jgi:DNA/RNA-binding protein KIN17
MNASGDLIKLDQDDLETVIPAAGGRVLIVNGAHRGAAARLQAIDVDNFCVALKIEDGPSRGRVVERIEYEDVCKLAEKD